MKMGTRGPHSPGRMGTSLGNGDPYYLTSMHEYPQSLILTCLIDTCLKSE